MRTTQTLPLDTQACQRPLRTVVRDLFLVIDRPVAAWQKRRQFRQELRRMPDYLLHDIGLTEAQARDEISKPFWRA